MNCRDDKALFRITWNKNRAALSALEKRLARIELQATGSGVYVTAITVVRQDGTDVVFEEIRIGQDALRMWRRCCGSADYRGLGI